MSLLGRPLRAFAKHTQRIAAHLTQTMPLFVIFGLRCVARDPHPLRFPPRIPKKIPPSPQEKGPICVYGKSGQSACTGKSYCTSIRRRAGNQMAGNDRPVREIGTRWHSGCPRQQRGEPKQEQRCEGCCQAPRSALSSPEPPASLLSQLNEHPLMVIFPPSLVNFSTASDWTSESITMFVYEI